MDLSIIIVNWNTRDLLRNCLASIRENAAGLQIETLVVDNKSADGSSGMVQAEFPEVILIQSGGNLGFARANNLAVPRAQAPYILFLNPDTEVRGDVLARMVRLMQANSTLGAVGCKIRDVSGEIQELGLQWFPSPLTELLKFCAVSSSTYRRLPALFPYHDPQKSGVVTKLFGACLMVPKIVIDRVGSFDDRFFMYCEDVDLCHRIGSAGWKVYYYSEAEILHMGASASEKAPGPFAVLMFCESFGKLMRKHHGVAGSFAYRVVALIGSQLRLLMLLALGVAQSIGLKKRGTPLQGSVRKYVTITRWTVGLDRPTIRN